MAYHGRLISRYLNPRSDKLVWLQGDMLDEHDKAIMENAISTPVAWQLAQDKQLFDKAFAVLYSHSLLRGRTED
ncbi:hypothetical protein CKO50_14825 [Pseudoalteromonas sp. HM-SA03]|uniref:hypothetical protein n=1 Tax=Pseudoalteromonas sp. HM-SA03 TaxID=2029678 RepID=UPI000BDDE377|nr:hypothetical protein [Pseudoalteromonas sp. HM-SA03]PAY00521.1 hypothetical protein CKO50_14825 [Pseudoalteromonas sp. HM-SA03]